MKSLNFYLIEKGANVNLIDGSWTPLNKVIHLRNMEMARLLIENGADMDLIDAKG